MKYKFWKKIYTGNPSRLARRALALTLALSMVLPVAAQGAEGMVSPTPPLPGEVPTITIEANAVVDRWYDPTSTAMKVEDYLTGELEVAIRVKSGKTDAGWQPFNTVGVALKYSPILTPYKFTLLDGIDLSGKEMSADDKKAAAEKVNLTGTATFKTMTNMQTLKCKNITAAVGHVSGEDGKGGYLFMEAQADRPLTLQEDTVLAVVTFRYDVSQYKIAASQAENWMTPAAATPPGTGGGGSDGGDSGSRAAGDICLLQFASMAELDGRYSKYELEYRSATNDMFYSATPDAGEVMGCLPLEDATVSKYQGPPTEGQVNFRLVNHTTYNDGGLTLDDLATVLFYDWDDTLLGLVIVPKDGDARKAVNDYISSHFIHPQLTTNTNYTSLARVDNYRGKYPTTAMSEEDAEKAANKATTVTNGGEYALTNKLDYVFFKRPMEQVTKVVDGKEVPTGEWKQKPKAGSDGSEGDWDTDYPYLHGWAIVPDYRHPENVWTTLGMGELNSYSGADLGGYKEISKAPATVTPADANFKFADFDFRVQNNNSLSAGSIYAVKAVYEPGEGLRSGAFQYRMISEPYYNKLNAGAASNGGAYSVDITFERASTQVDNFVRGVARTREPYVRQDTTVDSLWMVNEEKNIDHDLPNVTNYVAYTSKAETTYTKVEVKNSEEVFISLTLSARQNKVDYYLKEGYGANFVVGDARTPNDFNRSTQEATLDNYNYFVEGQSDEFDTWFDAAYGEREGTQGFVLNGTINQVMQKATQCINGEITVAEFNPFLTENVFKDMNLRLKTGKAPETASEITTARNAVLAAAEAAKPSNNSGSTKYWDIVHDCAQLTYHELQGFIIDGSLNHDESPIKDGGGQVLLTWCHLHKGCTDAVSTKPKDWAGLMDKAKNSPDDIDGLTPNEIENLFHLRKDSAGTKYDNVADFKADIVRAVNAVTGTMTTSWDQIQANILKETLPTQVNERNYWWYNGAESVPLNSLADTVAAAQDAITAVRLPDGTTMVRYDKLNQLKPAYEENKTSPTVARAWNNATKNLCITKDGSEGEKFGTFADFRTAFVAAVTQAENNNITLTTTNSAEVYAYWQRLQYHILKKSYSTTILPEMNDYWWYDGMSKIGDLPSLLAAAQRQVELDKAGTGAEDPVFKMLSATDLYDKKLKELHFRSNFHGDKYTDLTAFKNAVKAFVQLSGVTIAPPSSEVGSSTRTNSWNQLQYYLLHPGCDFSNSTTVTDYMKEIDYYWWRGGADGEAYPLTANPTTGIGTLMEAVYRHVVNGNPKAYDQLNAAAAAAFRLIPAYDKTDSTITGWDTLTKYSDTTINTLHTALDGLYAAIPSGTAYSAITWRQIQHYLLKTEYKPADGTDYPSDKRADVDGYWWKEGNERPTAGGDTKTDLDYFLAEFDKFLAGTIDNNALTGIDTEADSALDTYLFSGRLGIYGLDAADPKPLTACDSGDLVFVRFNLSDLANYMLDNGYTTAVGVIDWYVLQYYSMANDIAYGYGDPIISPADALDYYKNTLHGTWVPNEYQVTPTALDTPIMVGMGPDTTVEVDPETGFTRVTTTVETQLENGQTLVVETVVTIDPETNGTETRTVTTLLDEEGNVLASTETVTGQPEPPAESPAPTESETPAPSESVGADVPIGPETSPEPTESLGPDVSPSPEPEETPAPSESVGADVPIGPEASPEPTEPLGPDISPSPEPEETPEPAGSETPAPSESVGADVPIGPETSPEPTESLGPDVSPSPEPGETPEATESPEPADPGGADVPGDPQGTSDLSGPLARREKQTNDRLTRLALNWGRSRRPTSSTLMGAPRWTLPGLALDWRTILTIGRTHT